MKSTKDSLLEDIKAEFAEVNAMMEALEAKEPEDEASEAYDKWIAEFIALAIEHNMTRKQRKTDDFH